MILEMLSKAKDYLGRAIKFLGKLLGIVKNAEESLQEKAEEVSDKVGE